MPGDRYLKDPWLLYLSALAVSSVYDQWASPHKATGCLVELQAGVSSPSTFPADGFRFSWPGQATAAEGPGKWVAYSAQKKGGGAAAGDNHRNISSWILTAPYIQGNSSWPFTLWLGSHRDKVPLGTQRGDLGNRTQCRLQLLMV